MASITITVPDAEAARIENAFTQTYSYTGQNPQGGAETKNQFIKRMIIEFVKETVKRVEGEAAGKQARTAAEADVDGDLTLT